MLKNSLYMLLTSLFRLLTQVLIFVLLARAWGVQQFGLFMYPFTVASLLVVLVDYGFTLQLVRDAGKSPERVNEVVSQAIWAKVVLSVGVLVVSVGAGLILHCTGIPSLFLMLLIAAILNSFGVLLNLPFRALGRFDEETKVVLWSNAVHFLLIAVLVWRGQGPAAVAAGFLVARFFYLVTAYCAYRRVTGFRRFAQLDKVSLVDTLRSGMPFAVHVALGTLYFQVDTLMIQHFMGANGVGEYQAALRVIMGGLILADVLGNVYLPRLAKLGHIGSSLVETGTQMTRHLLLPGALGFVVFVILAPGITALLYGSGFAQVSRLLPLMAIVFFLRYLGTSYGTILTVADRQAVRAAGVSVAVAVSIAMNAVLIPRYGLPGAVYASIVTHVFLNSVYVAFAWQQTRSLLIDPRTLAVLGSLVVIVALWCFAGWDSPGTGPAAVAATACVVAFYGVTRNEWQSVWRRVSRA